MIFNAPPRPLTGTTVHWHGSVFLTLSVLEVVAPQRPDFVLTAHIPHCEADVLVFYSFNVEACTAEVEQG